MKPITLIMCLIVGFTAFTGTVAQLCSSFDPGCPSMVFAASVSLPECPENSEWNESSGSCLLPCSTKNTANITYVTSTNDDTQCVPVCPAGYAARGARNDGVACIKCGTNGTPAMGKKGNWVCRKGSQTSMPVGLIQLDVEDRDVADGGCPEGATIVNGMCSACSPTCDPYVSADPNIPAYNFYEAGGSVFCVPNECCIEGSYLVEVDSHEDKHH